MISVRYKGRLGNNLFQYSLGRILATLKGYHLHAKPIDGFPETNRVIAGRRVTTDVLTLGGQGHQHRIDLEGAIKHSGGIYLDGYFQVYEYYRRFARRIRDVWLKVDDPFEPQDARDAVIHIRRGDYTDRPTREVPAAYYHTAIQQLAARRIYIVSDGNFSQDSYFRQFDQYHPRMAAGNAWNDFRLIMSFSKIVISPSSFSWWAAFLSQAKDILMPSAGWTGMWRNVAEDRYFVSDGRFRVVQPE